MAADLLAFLLLQITVEVRNAETGNLIGPAEIVMERAEPPPRRRTTPPNGRIRFSDVTCSDEIKFSALLRDEPRFPRPSATVACTPPLVTLKVRPARRN